MGTCIINIPLFIYFDSFPSSTAYRVSLPRKSKILGLRAAKKIHSGTLWGNRAKRALMNENNTEQKISFKFKFRQHKTGAEWNLSAGMVPRLDIRHLGWLPAYRPHRAGSKSCCVQYLRLAHDPGGSQTPQQCAPTALLTCCRAFRDDELNSNLRVHGFQQYKQYCLFTGCMPWTSARNLARSCAEMRSIFLAFLLFLGM